MPLLILGVIGLLAYVAYTNSASASAWPPSAAVQQGLVNQIASMSAAAGSPMSASQLASLASSVNNMPTAYVATLSPGTQPSTALYQSWVLAQGQAAIQAGGASGYTTSGYVLGPWGG
jgi:hypothetical protein